MSINLVVGDNLHTSVLEHTDARVGSAYTVSIQLLCFLFGWKRWMRVQSSYEKEKVPRSIPITVPIFIDYTCKCPRVFLWTSTRVRDVFAFSLCVTSSILLKNLVFYLVFILSEDCCWLHENTQQCGMPDKGSKIIEPLGVSRPYSKLGNKQWFKGPFKGMEKINVAEVVEAVG